MKKYLLSIFTILMIVLSVNVVKAEKVSFYIMTKEGCTYCEATLENLAKVKSEHPDLFDAYEIEVFDSSWNARSNELYNLLINVYDRFELGDQIGTPTIVVGDYAVAAYMEADEIYEKVQEAAGKEDVFKELAEQVGVDLSQYNIDNVEPAKNDTLVIIGILVVLIGGFVALVYSGRK